MAGSARDGFQYLETESKCVWAARAGLGRSSRHASSTRPQQRDSQVAGLRGQLELPGRERRGSSGPGRQASLNGWFSPTPQGRLAPGFFSLLLHISKLILLLTPPTWGSEMANSQSGEGVLFCSVSIFTFYENAGARSLNAHVFVISWIFGCFMRWPTVTSLIWKALDRCTSCRGTHSSLEVLQSPPFPFQPDITDALASKGSLRTDLFSSPDRPIWDNCMSGIPNSCLS